MTRLDATYDRYIAVGLGGATGDVAGNRLNNARHGPGASGSSGLATSVQPVDWRSWPTPRLKSTVFYTPLNDSIQRQGPYGLLGARIEYGPRHRRWALAAYARNLTNTDYVTATFGTPPTAFAGFPGTLASSSLLSSTYGDRTVTHAALRPEPIAAGGNLSALMETHASRAP